MAEAGQDTDHVTFWRLMQGEPLPEVLDEIFARPKAPTALFLYADANIQYHLLPYLQTRGLLGKVEIAGIYNTPYARESGFASVSIKEDKIAESAVELLLDHADPHEVTIQPELIVHAASRQSGAGVPEC